MLQDADRDAKRRFVHQGQHDEAGPVGLGMAAQEAAITAFCVQHGYEIAAQYSEVETGKGHDARERGPGLLPPWRMPAS